MADNRDFFNALQNEGGSPTYCEDKKLSEISSKTTVGTDGVMLKGTDGAYYEIDKASLSEVIRAELGNILADNSKNNGTSVGKVPTLNSTGNALGASSVADLASVLGGQTIDVAQQHTIGYGIYRVNGSSSMTIEENDGLLIKVPGVTLKVTSYDTYKIALYIDNTWVVLNQ